MHTDGCLTPATCTLRGIEVLRLDRIASPVPSAAQPLSAHPSTSTAAAHSSRAIDRLARRCGSPSPAEEAAVGLMEEAEGSRKGIGMSRRGRDAVSRGSSRLEGSSRARRVREEEAVVCRRKVQSVAIWTSAWIESRLLSTSTDRGDPTTTPCPCRIPPSAFSLRLLPSRTNRHPPPAPPVSVSSCRRTGPADHHRHLGRDTEAVQDRCEVETEAGRLGEARAGEVER